MKHFMKTFYGKCLRPIFSLSEMRFVSQIWEVNTGCLSFSVFSYLSSSCKSVVLYSLMGALWKPDIKRLLDAAVCGDIGTVGQSYCCQPFPFRKIQREKCVCWMGGCLCERSGGITEDSRYLQQNPPSRWLLDRQVTPGIKNLAHPNLQRCTIPVVMESFG